MDYDWYAVQCNASAGVPVSATHVRCDPSLLPFTTITGSPEDPGIIPRAVATIFDLADKNRANIRVSVESYMVELYNDVLIDLYNFQDKKLVHLEGPSKLEISKDAKASSVCQHQSLCGACRS